MQKTEIGSRYPLPKPEMPQMHLRRRREGAGTFTKTLLVVKLTILLLTAAFLNVHANSKAQTVTLSGKDLTLKQVFAAIEKQTDYLAFYNQQMLANTKTVSLTVYDMPLADLLKTVLKDQPLDFTIQGKTIILSRKKVDDDAEKKSASIPPKLEVFAPPVSGRVLGEGGNPLAGATVAVKGRNKGTSTIANGSFSLDVKEGDILEISSVGYGTVLISYTGGQFKMVSGNAKNKAQTTGKLFQGENSFTVQLARSHNPLDEVQITAYGKTTKRLSTGSISTVTAEEIERQPVMTALEALIGKVPGAVIRQVSGNSAAPMQVTLRGRNSINPKAIADPLYVIDGIPQTTLNVSTFTGGQPFSTGAVQAGLTNTLGENPLLRINPRDIERIDVLKDADATAIYGSRGSNGAIIITTKKGKVGPASLSIDIDQGIKILERYPNLMGTSEYLSVRREAFRNEGTAPNRDNAPDLTVWDSTKYTNWQRLFVGTGSVTAVRASLSGGMGPTNYGLSANYNTSKEIMNNGGKNQVGSFNFNFGYASPNQKLRFNFTSRLGISEVNAIAIGDYGSLAPNAPDIYTADGQFNFVPYRISTGSLFPFGSLRRTSQSNTTNLSNNVNFEYEVLRGLSFSVAGGYDFTQNSNVNKNPASAKDPAYLPPIDSDAYFGKSTNKNWTIRSQASYRTNIGRGKLDVNLIANMQSVTTHGETIIALDFPNDASMKSYLNAQTKDLQQGYGEYKYVSASGIIKYNWDNKYVINLGGTRDGSSRFAPGKQFGNFGSVGLRWNASDEKWLNYLLPAWFNYLGFSGSYGIAGGDAGSDYEYLSRWAQSVSGTNTLYSYNGVLGYQVVSPLNQEFHWESNRKTNIAVNMGFLNNKISVDFQLYRNVASNQLAKMPTPKFTGFSNALINSPATVENKGIEGSIRATLIEKKDWGLSFDFNIGANRNRIIAFPDLESSSYKDQIKIGASTSSLMALRYIGIDPMTGNYTFEDHNKDGKVYSDGTIFPNTTVDDRYILIDLTPKYSGGFGFNLNYKSVSLYTSFYFINKLRQDPYLTAIPGSQNNMELSDEIKNNHWKQPGDRVKYPRYVNDASLLGPINMSDAYYVNGSYLRLSNLSIQWQLPDTWTKKVKVKGARFSIRTQNLFTLSQFRGLDPEVGSSAYQTPIPRTIATNLSFNF